MKYLLNLFLLILVLGCSKQDDEVIVKSSEKELKSFSIKEISESFEFRDLIIETTLKKEMDLTSLTGIFTVSEKAKVYVGNTLQKSGVVKNNFTKSVTYSVVAEDGTKTTYVVTINFQAKLKVFSIVELKDVNFKIQDTVISAEVPAGTNTSNLTADFTLTEGAKLYVKSTLQVSKETKNNFESDLIYQLKNKDKLINSYIVKLVVAVNNLPIAKAGEDISILIAQGITTGAVTLDASESSDVEGEIVKYEWKSDAGIIATEKIAYVELGIGIHNIVLTVTDTLGATAVDEVVIEIRIQGEYIPVDGGASEKTKNLYNKIASIANSEKFAFGQEFPLSFKLNGLSSNLSTSDCYDVVGDHPGVYGIDPHYMLYKTTEEKQLHIDEAKHAYDNGSIVTFDFHQQSKNDHKIYYNDISSELDKSLMYDIVNDLNGSRDWFYGELDQTINIINNDLGFPVVFRLFHEMNGNWFWWGTKATQHSTQLYIDFYRLTFNYIKNKTDLVLFSWSPNQELDESYYPGDDYVDVVGIDLYNSSSSILKNNLISLSNFTTNHGKVAALTETGKNNYVNLNPSFWSSNVLESINSGGEAIKIAWVLAWFNAPWKSSQSDLFIPNSDSSLEVKNDFIKFYNDQNTLFQQEIKELKVYE